MDERTCQLVDTQYKATPETGLDDTHPLRACLTTVLAAVLMLQVPSAISSEKTVDAPSSPRPDAEKRTSTEDTFGNTDVEIVLADDRVIYEYRVNGVLTAIKVVPKQGRPYYMVPADGSPHYEINHDATLYPKWILLEW